MHNYLYPAQIPKIALKFRENPQGRYILAFRLNHSKTIQEQAMLLAIGILAWRGEPLPELPPKTIELAYQILHNIHLELYKTNLALKSEQGLVSNYTPPIPSDETRKQTVEWRNKHAMKYTPPRAVGVRAARHGTNYEIHSLGQAQIYKP